MRNHLRFVNPLSMRPHHPPPLANTSQGHTIIIKNKFYNHESYNTHREECLRPTPSNCEAKTNKRGHYKSKSQNIKGEKSQERISQEEWPTYQEHKGNPKDNSSSNSYK